MKRNTILTTQKRIKQKYLQGEIQPLLKGEQQ